MSYIVFLKVFDIEFFQNINVYIPYIFMEWNGESDTCAALATLLFNAGYTPWQILIIFLHCHMDLLFIFNFRLSDRDGISISLSGVCLLGGCSSEDDVDNQANMGVMWRHIKEKPIWPQKEGKCICVPNSAGEKNSHIGVSYSLHDRGSKTKLLHYGVPSVVIVVKN